MPELANHPLFIGLFGAPTGVAAATRSVAEAAEAAVEFDFGAAIAEADAMLTAEPLFGRPRVMVKGTTTRLDAKSAPPDTPGDARGQPDAVAAALVTKIPMPVAHAHWSLTVGASVDEAQRTSASGTWTDDNRIALASVQTDPELVFEPTLSREFLDTIVTCNAAQAARHCGVLVPDGHRNDPADLMASVRSAASASSSPRPSKNGEGGTETRLAYRTATSLADLQPTQHIVQALDNDPTTAAKLNSEEDKDPAGGVATVFAGGEGERESLELVTEKKSRRMAAALDRADSDYGFHASEAADSPNETTGLQKRDGRPFAQAKSAAVFGDPTPAEDSRATGPTSSHVSLVTESTDVASAAKYKRKGTTASGGWGGEATPTSGDPRVSSSAATASRPTPFSTDRSSNDLEQRIDRSMAPTMLSDARSAAVIQQTTATPNLAAFGLSPSSAAPLPQYAVAAPVGSAGFVEEFTQRVAILSRGGVHRAELSLAPADLGPVEISIEVRGDEATLIFTAPHAVTRAALDEALPRLREMLNAQGLQLADARVGTQAGGGSWRDSERRPQGFIAAATDRVQATPDAAAPVTVASARPRTARLIDDIA